MRGRLPSFSNLDELGEGWLLLFEEFFSQFVIAYSTDQLEHKDVLRPDLVKLAFPCFGLFPDPPLWNGLSLCLTALLEPVTS